MPRFTGQNKKRIDPRYFLQETVDRGSPKLPPLNIRLTNNPEKVEPKLKGLNGFLRRPGVGQLIAKNLTKLVNLRDMGGGIEKFKQFIPNKINIADLLNGLNIPTEWGAYKLDASLAFADMTKPLDPNNPPTLNIGLSGEF